MISDSSGDADDSKTEITFVLFGSFLDTVFSLKLI